MSGPSRTAAIAMALAMGLTAGPIHAAGFALIENNASGLGNAYAGAAAIGEDASTVYFNPAAMTRLQRTQLLAALHLVNPKTEFSDGGSTAATGGRLTGPASSGGKNALIPNLYAVKPLGDGRVFGIGLNVPFGMETEYDDNWVGRYHGVKSAVKTININPSLAWPMGKGLSLGMGFNLQYIDVTLTSAVDLGAVCLAAIGQAGCTNIGVAPQQSDGFVELSGDAWSWGYNLGLVYEFATHGQTMSRLGLAYRSNVKHNLAGQADFTVPSKLAFLTAGGNFVDTPITSSVDLPETVSLSLVHEHSEALTLLFDWTWTAWSRFQELRIDYASAQPDSVTTEEWTDSNRYALGANYRLSPAITLRAGLALDQSPIPNAQRRTARIPGNDRRWLALGLGYRVDKRLNLDLGYARLFVSDTPIDNTFESSVPTLGHTLKGQYQGSANILSAQATWRF